jgi:hypothetical protein
MEKIKEMVDCYLSTNSAVEKILPLCHTTTQDIFVNKIITEKLLRPRPCHYHNNENLIFFFYGKCPYIHKKHQNVSVIKNPPITFLFNYETLEKYAFERLVSFDSGGYVDGRYVYDKDTNPSLDTFIIEKPSKKDVIGLLQILYKTNNNYLENNLDLYYAAEDYPISPCVKGFYHLLGKMEGTDGSSANFGEQALTFELQIKEVVIPLEPDVIFIPNDMYNSNPAMDSWIKKFPSATIETYVVKKFCHDVYCEMKSKVLQYIIKSNTI